MSSGSAESTSQPRVLVVMGVSGCGKSTVAALLAGRYGWPFEEGDSLHPQSNVDKMRAGHPLTDDDRRPWLEKVRAWIEHQLDAGRNGVITCSALKRSYRDALNRRGDGVVFVYLAGDQAPSPPGWRVRQAIYMPPACCRASSTASRSRRRRARHPGGHRPTARAIVQHVIDQLESTG